MENTKAIVDEMKGIECPTDQIINRVIGVLEKYGSTGSYQIFTEEDNDFIHDGLRVYKAYAETFDDPSFEIVVTEGMDHYVAKIVGVNIINEGDNRH